MPTRPRAALLESIIPRIFACRDASVLPEGAGVESGEGEGVGVGESDGDVTTTLARGGVGVAAA